MTSQPGLQTTAIHVLINTSRSEGNQTTTFGQLIEYDMRNIFLEKSYTKCAGETIPRRFSEKSKFIVQRICRNIVQDFRIDFFLA